MVECNRIFRLLLFSGILGQAHEVHLKFRNEIPENALSIRSSPGISGIFGRIESALGSRDDIIGVRGRLGSRYDIIGAHRGTEED